MRVSTQAHQFDWGNDVQARTRYLCILNWGGARLVYRNMKAAPEPVL